MSTGRRRRRRGGSDLGVRILAAIPAIAYGIFIIVAGGWVFAVGILLLGVVCLHELFRMYDHVRPVRLAGFLGVIALTAAAHYGGRAEIVDAARSFQGTTEEEFRRHLYAPEMHDPDLIIRTSGEQRLSNYLLWQSAYSELHFTEVLWPDFSREDFEAALGEYEVRRRRFGGR